MTSTVPNLSAAVHLITKDIHSDTIIIVPKEQLNRVYDEVSFFLGGQTDKISPLCFPDLDLMPYEERRIDRQILDERLNFLYRFMNRKGSAVVVTDARALFYKICNPYELKDNFISISVGEDYPVDKFIEKLANYGYAAADKVFQSGQYCIRGGIIDCFIPIYDEPVRIEFFGDEIESMRFFSCDTQLSTRQTEQISIGPANEFKKAFDIDESMWVRKNFSFQTPDLFEGFNRIFVGDVNFDELYKDLNWRYDNRSDIYLLSPDTITVERKKIAAIESDALRLFIGPTFSEYTEPVLNGNFNTILEKIKNLSNRFQVKIVSDDNDAQNRTEKLFGQYSNILCINGKLADNFCIGRTCFLSFAMIFGNKTVQQKQSPRHSGREHSIFNTDDIIVHKDCGIGRFKGIVQINDSGCKSHMYKIAYRNDESLYVSIMDAAKITKYEGLDPQELDLLGSNAFKIRKRKAYDEIMRMAKQFASIYANRFIARRLPYDLENSYLFEFEQTFPYTETADQKQAIRELKSDMLRDIPMDRLITGGTGYGKTEVILRAAAIAVFSGRQVLIASPTTILADQHYDVFCGRFSGFPINIKRSDKIDNSDLKGCDIVIGTQGAAKFSGKLHNLSLVIIDEEQRFGVKFKEQFKKNHAAVDLLTVSATPIPRTMQMVLSGIWDINVINTPPADRVPIDTEIRIKSDRIVQDIILWELKRGGQIYYVHNRIEDIDEVFDKIAALVKNARIAIVHGRLTKGQIESRMKDFRMKKYDILLSTSIIESGLDIPDVNTIVVDEAENFGLADLYQLRGRVGRSGKGARAVFFVNKISRLTESAKKRLSALKEFSKDFGSSFDLALSDSRIRGTGNPLGTEQKGKSHFLGFSLYHQMVKDAVAQIKGAAKKESSAEISWDLPSYIPDDLMSQDDRLVWYQRIGDAGREQIKRLLREAYDRYGRLPDEFQNLFFAAEIGDKAAEIGVKKIDFHNKCLILKFKKNPPVATSSIINIIDSYKGKAGFAGENDVYFKGVSRFMDLNKIISCLEKAI